MLRGNVLVSGETADADSIDEESIRKVLELGSEKAEKLLRNADKLEETLLRLEEKLKEIPAVGNLLSDVPVLVLLVRDYTNGRYNLAPMGSIVAVLSALLYVASPIDLIPDAIPVAGYVDDAAVVAACMKLVASDVEEYRAWRALNEQ